MPHEKSNNPADVIELLGQLTVSDKDGRLKLQDGRDFAAVLLGRQGGLKGGRRRAQSLTAEQRSEIAAKAARERWARNKSMKDESDG